MLRTIVNVTGDATVASVVASTEGEKLNLLKMNNINIYLEANPNPNSLKFVTDKMLLDDKIIKDYPDIESANDSPIAKKLFLSSTILKEFLL